MWYLKQSLMWCLTVLLMVSVSAASQAAEKKGQNTGHPANPQPVRYFQIDDRYQYQHQLLSLVLEKTRSRYGDFQLRPEQEQVTQARGLYMLRNHQVDLCFLPTSTEREQQFLAIKTPLMRGLLGYRLLMINKARRRAFAEIDSLEELINDYSAGFGRDWADKNILTDNNIIVRTSATYPNLFAMLAKQRFDYFPRGLTEVWQEIDKFGPRYHDLMIEPRLALYYPFPVYFFVNKQNPQLAERIEKGLEMALSDGSFKTLFMNHFEQSITRARLTERKVFYLDNLRIPPGSSEPDTSWWFSKSAGSDDVGER